MCHKESTASAVDVSPAIAVIVRSHCSAMRSLLFRPVFLHTAEFLSIVHFRVNDVNVSHRDSNNLYCHDVCFPFPSNLSSVRRWFRAFFRFAFVITH